jgi:hypothetical protein
MRVFYRHDYEGRKKLIGVGDAYWGRRCARSRAAAWELPSVWFDDDGGDRLRESGGRQPAHLQFAPDGKMTSLRVNSQAGILYRHPQQGVLLYANP